MTNEAKQQWLVWWALWLAFQIGIFVIYQLIGGSLRQPAPPTESAVWMLAFVPVAISVFIRWTMLPRVETAYAALPLFVVGLAFAEAACFLGLFVFPAHRQVLFAAGAAGIFQFIPFFARRFFPD